MIDTLQLQKETQNLTVLYAEDEDPLRENMGTSLSRLFKQVYLARDGQEAYDILKKEHIDLIVTDINMPRLNGIEFIEKIHSDSMPPVIVLTAHEEVKYLVKLINLDVNYFLNKPIHREQLINILYKACTRINNDRLIEEYRNKLELAVMEAEKKNRILETKLKQMVLKNNEIDHMHLVQEEMHSGEYKQQEDVLNTHETKHHDSSYHDIHPELDHEHLTLSGEDLDDLKDISVEIDSCITLLFQSKHLEEHYMEKVSNAYSKYAKVLHNYYCYHIISDELHELANAIEENHNSIIMFQDAFAVLLESFHFSLEVFRLNLETKALPATFYNSSLISDIQSIIRLLTNNMPESEVTLF